MPGRPPIALQELQFHSGLQRLRLVPRQSVPPGPRVLGQLPEAAVAVLTAVVTVVVVVVNTAVNNIAVTNIAVNGHPIIYLG